MVALLVNIIILKGYKFVNTDLSFINYSLQA